MAQFRKIDFSAWKRTPYFNHYFKQLRCTYSITANLDITHLKQNLAQCNGKLYPILIYATAAIVNRHEEFRTAVDAEGNVGIWDTMNPSYTVFHKESETFSSIWSCWNSDLTIFLSNYHRDMACYGDAEGILTKPDIPENCFPISCLPWVSFTAFNLNIFADGSYLLPIFTWGKYFETTENGQTKLQIPLSIQVHHAVCDGFHTARFINELQELLNNLSME